MRMQLKQSGLFIFLLFFLLLFSCSSETGSTASKENSTGITDTQILIGSSLALEGHAGYLGTQMLQGAMAYIHYINNRGGIYGRSIKVIALDDSYNPTLCLYNTQRLISEKKVFSLFCYVGTPTTVRILPLVNEVSIPLVGMLTGSNRLRQPPNKYLINIRASYYQETEAAVDLIVREKKLKRVAVFYQYDEYGFDGLRGTEIALKKYGLIPVAKGSYIRGTLDVEAGFEKIFQSGAEAVVMIGTYDSCAKFINLSRQSSYNPLFHNVSFVGSRELARRLGKAGEGVIVTQVVPPPYITEESRTLPGVKEYVALLDRFYPRSRPSFVGLEGYLNAKILSEGLKRAGQDITREKFIKAIETIDKYDMGIENLISFGKNDYQGLDNVYFTMIRDGELVLIQ